MYLQCNTRIRLISSMTRSVPCLRNCKSLKGQKSINGIFFIEIQYKNGYWKYANTSEYYNIIKIISKSNIFSEKPFYAFTPFFRQP